MYPVSPINRDFRGAPTSILLHFGEYHFSIDKTAKKKINSLLHAYREYISRIKPLRNIISVGIETRPRNNLNHGKVLTLNKN
jgi:hypothetical protein